MPMYPQIRLARLAPWCFIACVAGFSFYVDQRLEAHRSQHKDALDAVDRTLVLASDEGPAELGTMLEEPVTVLALWASWCRGCAVELPLLAPVHEDAPGVGVLAVNVDEDAAAYASYRATHDFPFPSVRDADRNLSKAVGLQVLPMLIVLDRAGRVLDTHAGPASATEINLYVQRWQAAVEDQP